MLSPTSACPPSAPHREVVDVRPPGDIGVLPLHRDAPRLQHQPQDEHGQRAPRQDSASGLPGGTERL
eukprot:11227896-Lingulodinium_polyedra.AAC.1